GNSTESGARTQLSQSIPHVLNYRFHSRFNPAKPFVIKCSGKPSGTYSKCHTRPLSDTPLAIKEKTEFGEAATEWLCPIVDADAQERTFAGNASVEVSARFRGHSGRIVARLDRKCLGLRNQRSPPIILYRWADSVGLPTEWRKFTGCVHDRTKSGKLSIRSIKGHLGAIACHKMPDESRSCLLVAPDDDDHEGPWLGDRTTGYSWFLFLELGCGQIHFMRLGVNVHCSSADR